MQDCVHACVGHVFFPCDFRFTSMNSINRLQVDVSELSSCRQQQTTAMLPLFLSHEYFAFYPYFINTLGWTFSFVFLLSFVSPSVGIYQLLPTVVKYRVHFLFPQVQFLFSHIFLLHYSPYVFHVKRDHVGLH